MDSSTTWMGAPPAPDVGEVGGLVAARPVPARGTVAEEPAADEVGQQVGGRGAEQREVVLGQRHLGRRRAQVGFEDVGVVGIEDGGLDRRPEDRLRVVDEERVERVVPRHEDRQGGLPGTSGTSRLLPEGRARPRPPAHEDGVEPGDVDAQFQSVRARQADERARAQGGFQGAPLLRAGSGAVGGDLFGQGGRYLVQCALGAEGHRLRTAP